MKHRVKIAIIIGLLLNAAPAKAGFLWDFFIGYFFIKGLLCHNNILIHCGHCVHEEKQDGCTYCFENNKTKTKKNKRNNYKKEQKQQEQSRVSAEVYVC